MNLVNVASLLGDVKASEVRYGTHAIERANGSLSRDNHITAEVNGEELLQAIEHLPMESRAVLQHTNVLSPTEMQEMVSDITAIKMSSKYTEAVADRESKSLALMYCAGILVISAFALMTYIFIVVANGDTLGGVVYTAVQDVWKQAAKVVTSTPPEEK